MKVLVCGSRDMPYGFASELLMIEELGKLQAKHVIQGGARGADHIAKIVGLKLGLHVDEYPADWESYGKIAGKLRNQRMLDQNPDVVLAFHPKTGITPGTKDMVTRATKAGVKVVIVTYEIPDERSTD